MDETYIGGKEKNKHAGKKLNAGRGTIGKVAVVGVKDRETNEVRAKVVDNTDGVTLQGMVHDNAEEGTMVYSDSAKAYPGLPNHEFLNHSVREYVRDQAHTNGMESFWSMLKRGYHGTYHKMSKEHLNRYVTEFSGRHNVRVFDTMEQLERMVTGMDGRQLRYKDLIGNRKRALPESPQDDLPF